ncbi:universal stress protein [Luteolibacter marinus]|uniref:universal stress protein n=1 Tax=Luteolibacter marinus TaxID=2776705 RepID=UPI001867E951|nr:universal stress protein [Luteolibacter marinus]
MNPNAPVVAGIDFTAPSPSVLLHALHTAALTGAPVIAVHVLDSGILSHLSASAGSNPVLDQVVEQGRHRLAQLVSQVDPGAKVRLEIRNGRPAEELHRLVEEEGASLLVIAANDLTKKRLGSIASRCVRTAPCDVLVLRDWQEGNFSKVVVCTDFSPTSELALARGVTMAAANGARLEIVHVMYPPTRDVWGEVLDHEENSEVSYETECRDRANKAMAGFLAPSAEALSRIDHAPVLLESTMPSMALTHHIQDTEADLVILGTRGMSRVAGFFIGTNAERLLHDAQVSVLAVRD